MKTKCIAILLSLLGVSTVWGDENSPLSQVAQHLSQITRDMNPLPQLTKNARDITLSYNTRKFMVHTSDKQGRHSEKAHEAIGPGYDGLIVRVSVHDGRYNATAVIPQNLRSAYWTTFINAYPVAGGKQYLHVNISFGSRTDRKIIEKVKDILDSVIDDDLDVNAYEVGVPNEAIEGD